MSLLYLDTCCIIYLIEAAGPFHAAVDAFFTGDAQLGKCTEIRVEVIT